VNKTCPPITLRPHPTAKTVVFYAGFYVILRVFGELALTATEWAPAPPGGHLR
jgi:hypothetical protein